MNRVFNYLCTVRLIPHLIIFYISPLRELLEYERDKWLETHNIVKKGWRGFLLLLNSLPEYRSLFYFRTGNDWLSIFARPQNNLEFYTESHKIGRGLVIWHGFSSVINVESMGNDCQIWQNVTIGKSSTSPERNRPTIGNNVRIAAGAIVIGNIHVGNGSTIGAGSVAVKDVPENAIVVNQPSRMIIK